MSEVRAVYQVSGQEHAADGARPAERFAGAPDGPPFPAQQQSAHPIDAAEGIFYGVLISLVLWLLIAAVAAGVFLWAR